jgi:hypothetical protein
MKRGKNRVGNGATGNLVPRCLFRWLHKPLEWAGHKILVDVKQHNNMGSDTSFLECPPSTVVRKKHKIVPALMDRAVCKSY